MKLIRILLLVIGVGFAGGGVYFATEPPPATEGVVKYLPAGMMFLFSIVMFALFVPMLSGLADTGKLLRTGTPATATIVDIQDTASTVNQQPVLRFTADVARPDGSTYRASFKQIVSRASLGSLRPGITVPVRVDPSQPNRVAIDPQGAPATVPAGAADAIVSALAGGIPPEASVKSAADVVRDGVPSTATVQSVSMTGKTLGQLKPDADPATAADPVVVLGLEVALADGRTVTARGAHRVPGYQLDRLAPGATVPVAYLPSDPASATTIDWDRLSRA